jgi:two-component system CheB/CheR fusion protein
MQDTVGVMGTLLDALLDINQLDSGAIKPEWKDFSIGTLLDRLRLDFHHHSGEKGLSLRVVPSTAIVRSDPTLLENIIRNLLANAIRYTDEGRVLLGCRRRGDRLRIEVRDTGIGIPETHIERIFEEFYQLDNPARDRNKGLGLGLAVVQRTARLLGHAVEVQSCPDQGSVFAVEVPLGTAAEQPEDEAQGGSVPDKQRNAASVVLIEDEALVLEITKTFLELDGYRVHTAADAEAAARLIQSPEMRPDLIITDYRLPRSRTGIEVVQLIREHVALDVPGIVLTGDTSPVVAQEARAHRVQILHKPVHPEELSVMIRQLLKGAGRSQSCSDG